MQDLEGENPSQSLHTRYVDAVANVHSSSSLCAVFSRKIRMRWRNLRQWAEHVGTYQMRQSCNGQAR